MTTGAPSRFKISSRPASHVSIPFAGMESHVRQVIKAIAPACDQCGRRRSTTEYSFRGSKSLRREGKRGGFPILLIVHVGSPIQVVVVISLREMATRAWFIIALLERLRDGADALAWEEFFCALLDDDLQLCPPSRLLGRHFEVVLGACRWLP